ncbi:uncharacterized protein J7T54_000461 [Emericellopsis cladophorae]|uniref:Uncharacterized protein n=1 Tax=Emericellopsis cladophorae TaxID=2686198 RepID=A0A9P9XXA6_9HYPO|nr:uncharacterized protein J7T54_000461 [Emericellopsis cladophorae]KAI6779363.1 hypothetical protein J7T54_000461 [Emericellopsis cladophorae]
MLYPIHVRGSLPKGLSEELDRGLVSKIYTVALGAQGSCFIIYLGRDGLDHFYSYGLPRRLQDWLSARSPRGRWVGNLRGLRLCLGPDNASYWAADGADSISENLPSGLQVYLSLLPNNGVKLVDCISLGCNGTYYLRTSNGRHRRNIAGSAKLSDYLDSVQSSAGNLTNVAGLALHPVYKDTWILQSANGFSFSNGLDAQAREAFDNIQPAVEAKLQRTSLKAALERMEIEQMIAEHRAKMEANEREH